MHRCERNDGAIRRLLVAMALILTLPGLVMSARAQVTTTVLGTVKDAQGGVLPGATVLLISETRGTRTEPVFTNSSGDFVFPNVTPDTYTLQVEMPSFRTLQQRNLQIGADPRVVVGTLTLEVGGASEVVNVTAGATLVQAASGERSFRIDATSVENLPISNRSMTSLAALAPGVDVAGTGVSRVGGGGDSNIVMDGVSTSSPGNNATMIRMNPESLAEVRVLTAGYQAEYGRAAGVQVTSITRSGSNQFRGSVYDVERNSDWNANSRTNILNGDQKTVAKERDFGFSIGGPVGRPGGDNKLFFFYTHEVQPRTAGGNTVRYRLPTALERAGDFSQSTDNNGALYPYIKNPNLPGACTAANQSGCYADGGVLGRIPASDLYAPGLALLNMYPAPNVTGQIYNFQLTRPTEKATGHQPVARVDVVPTPWLRGSYRLAQSSQSADQVFNGTLPGFNNTRMANPVITSQAMSFNWTVRPTIFIEAAYGRTRNELSGCGLGGGGTPGPTFCTAGFPVGDLSNMNSAGIGGIPLIYPGARVVDPKHYTYRAMNAMNLPMWDGTSVLLPPQFQFGSRVANAPPGNLLTSFYNTSLVQDFSASITIVAGSHTIKAGVFNLAQSQAQITGGAGGAIGTLSFAQDQPGVNPFDTSFGFANAAIGTYGSYSQGSRFIEYNSVIRNTDFYVQDNWKVNSRWTLDYGLRFVHQVPDYEKFADASNFLPDQWSMASAPALYLPGCANGVYPCTGTNRQAMNPITGVFMGPNSSIAIGTIVPNTGDALNGLRQQGQGIVREHYVWPALAVAPRFGTAYDLTGTQSIVVRGSLGLFFDRTAANSTRAAGSNPPIADNVVLRYGQLQNLTGGLAVKGAPVLGGAWEYEPAGLPSSTQWNVGAQFALPRAMALDVSYVGQHSFNTPVNANINAVDFGSAFLPQYQDPTLAANVTPGATALTTDLLRSVRGYGAITQVQQNGWRTYHSVQFSLNRRFANGLSFGFSDTWSLSDHQSTALRFDHTADGRAVVRADQVDANRLLGTAVDQAHLLRANFVWDMPDLRGESSAARAIGWIVNGWQVAGVWTGRSGSPYAVGYSYQSGGGNLNLTGSPDYAARVNVVGDPGAGCGSDALRQFNTGAFEGPSPGSVGLESGNAYLKGCFSSVLDLSLSRSFRLGGTRTVQVRADIFNAPNRSGITGRNTTMNLSNPLNPTTINNLPFDANGQVVASRSLPSNAGFGVATGYQAPRAMQLQVRFAF